MYTVFLMYIDIDECERNLASCDQGCDNLVGSFSCYCHSGFYPTLDGVSCISELDSYCVCVTLVNVLEVCYNAISRGSPYIVSF